MAYGREHIQHFALILRCIANTVGRKDGQAQALRNAQRCLVACLFGAVAVALQFDIHIAPPKHCNEPLDACAACCFSAPVERRRQRPFFSTRHAEEAAAELRQVVQGCRAFALARLAHFEACDELAEILIARARRA